jgi:hypothetical protein
VKVVNLAVGGTVVGNVAMEKATPACCFAAFVV